MAKIIILFGFLFLNFSFAQDPQAYNEIYTKTYLETAQNDMKAALKVADSLYKSSETPLFKTKSLMLSASLYMQSGEVQKAVEYAVQSGEIIGQTDNYSWQARVYGFLATQYRFLKLYDFSKQYLEKAIEVSKKIENPKAANNVRGLMFQEKAFYEIMQKQYRKAIVNINKSQSYFKQTDADMEFLTANNEQLLGLSYYQLQNLDDALVHYEKALRLTEKIPKNYLVGLIYNGFANIYLDKKEIEKAKNYLDKAENIAAESEYLELKKEVISTSKKYLTAVDDLDKLVDVQKIQDSITERITANSNAFINNSFSTLDKSKNIVEKKSSNKTLIVILCLLLISLGVVYSIYSKRKHKKKLEHFNKILKDLDQRLIIKRESITELTSKIKVTDQAKTEVSAMINEETVQKILGKLQEFEESKLFTENSISLSTLSTYCETNGKYLSHVINTYKKKDFNNYINELRINYIITKLKDVPIYRKYKIAVLSEEAGFSSQNKFSTVFKNITTISPSTFISSLQESEGL